MQLSRKKQMKARAKQTPRALLWRRVGWGVLLLLVVGLLIAGVWYGARTAEVTIDSIDVVGGETIAHDEIRSLAENELTGAYYLLIPKTFAWTYPRERITTVVHELERVKHVAVQRTDWNTILVVFEEYQPYALWCDAVDGAECFFIDRNGYAFTKAPALAGGAFVRYVDQSITQAVGASVFSADFVRRTNEFVETAYQELELNIVSVEKTNTQELQYHIAGGGRIRTSLLESYEDTMANLKTILGSAEFQHLEPGNFQYIDLRFGNKVFVNEELTEPEVGSSTASTTEEVADVL